MLVDVHAHMDLIGNLDHAIQKCRENNFYAVISNGTNLNDNQKVLDISKKYGVIKSALGFYPDEVDFLDESDIEESFSFIKKNIRKLTAIGEIGLDFSNKDSNKKKQIDVFNTCIELAEKNKLPIIVHSRKAELEITEILESSSIKKVVMHCFSGNFKLIKRLYEKNFSFSIPCIINRSEHFQKIVKEINLDNILTESDAPFLSPFPDKKNKPYFIKNTINEISKIKNLDNKIIEDTILENYKKMFSNNLVH
jgi:TatD DNase family protein